MWDTRPIEKRLYEKLTNSRVITPTEGEEYYAHYISARKKLVDEILPDIKAIEKNLTDHGPAHIANVLDNIYRLINVDKLEDLELYALCMITLFHDVGNINGRIGHYDKRVIYKIYSYVRGDDPRFNTERQLISITASAHSGKASNGSEDTISELQQDKVPLFDHGINVRKLAAILRFADELAEGPQRTSNYMILNHKYDEESLKHHNYARSSSVLISRKDNRISLTYWIKIKTENEKLIEETKKEMKLQLEYIYKRILKLNAERIYNKYYCDMLSPFKTTSVQINFEVDGELSYIGLDPLNITDMYLHEDTQKGLSQYNNSYDAENVIKLIEEFCNNR
jgi:hypothetical protein